MAEKIFVMEPIAPYGRKQIAAHGGLGDLKGKVVGFIDKAKPNFNHLADDLAELLIGRYGAKGAVKCNKRSPGIPAPAEVMQQIVAECDVVITGSGD